MHQIVMPVDIERYTDKEQPFAIIDRARPAGRNSAFTAATTVHPGHWCVVSAQLASRDDPVRWSTIRREQYVRVPLFPYRTDKSITAAMVAGTQLGAIAMAQLPDHKLVDALYVMAGNSYVVDDQFEIWLGLAFKLE